MRAAIVVHEPGQGAGRVGHRLRERGVETVDVVVCPVVGEPAGALALDDLSDVDLIVAMGARWHVHEPEPIAGWIHDELDLIRRADEAEIPVFGICFGAQLIAAALGGSVGPCSHTQIGWWTPTTRLPQLSGPWFEWHSDGVTPPDGSAVLADDEVAVQAFRIRRNLAVQFHPEVGVDHLRGWLRIGGAEALADEGVDADALVTETERNEADAFRRCDELVDWFLDEIAASG